MDVLGIRKAVAGALKWRHRRSCYELIQPLSLWVRCGYRSVAGIDTDPMAPGYRQTTIHPRPDTRITHARGEYNSVYGRIVSDCNGIPAGPFSLKVRFPPTR